MGHTTRTTQALLRRGKPPRRRLTVTTMQFKDREQNLEAADAVNRELITRLNTTGGGLTSSLIRHSTAS
ncbi:hypothetical protein GCM10029964_089780 [Kibdelosporangium lantanae]